MIRSSGRRNGRVYCPLLLTEPQGKEIGLAHYHAETNGLARQGTHVSFLPPGHHPVQRVAEEFITVGECEAGQRRAGGVLQFDAEVPRGGGGEVQRQFLAAEEERLR